MRRFWDKSAYMNGASAGPEGDANAGPKVDIVDDAVQSSLFWGLMVTLSYLGKVICTCFEWAEGCPCHTNLDWSDISCEKKRLWERCVLRGLRLCELSSCDFLQMFQELCQETIVDLLMDLPRDLSVSDRNICVQEWERGRSQLLFVFTLKVAYEFVSLKLKI